MAIDTVDNMRAVLAVLPPTTTHVVGSCGCSAGTSLDVNRATYCHINHIISYRAKSVGCYININLDMVY